MDKGWTADEWRQEIRMPETTTKKITCEACGRTFLVDEDWDEPFCPVCLEIHA